MVLHKTIQTTDSMMDVLVMEPPGVSWGKSPQPSAQLRLRFFAPSHSSMATSYAQAESIAVPNEESRAV